MIGSVVVHVEQRHRVVITGGRGREGRWKCQRIGVYLDTAARFQILHLLRRNPHSYLVDRIEDGAARRLGAEHHDHTTRDAVVGGFARQRDAKRQRMMSGRVLRAEKRERERYQGDTTEVLSKHDVHSAKMYGA